MYPRTSEAPRPRSSFIFTPGLRPDMFPKALASGADMVCVEPDDGVAPGEKSEARIQALALFEQPQDDNGAERIVRINSLRERFGIEDVNAILTIGTPPPALMMPKVLTPDEVVLLDRLLAETGHVTRLHVIIEANAGLEAASDIARYVHAHRGGDRLYPAHRHRVRGGRHRSAGDRLKTDRKSGVAGNVPRPLHRRQGCPPGPFTRASNFAEPVILRQRKSERKSLAW